MSLKPSVRGVLVVTVRRVFLVRWDVSHFLSIGGNIFGDLGIIDEVFVHICPGVGVFDSCDISGIGRHIGRADLGGSNAPINGADFVGLAARSFFVQPVVEAGDERIPGTSCGAGDAGEGAISAAAGGGLVGRANPITASRADVGVVVIAAPVGQGREKEGDGYPQYRFWHNDLGSRSSAFVLLHRYSIGRADLPRIPVHHSRR